MKALTSLTATILLCFVSSAIGQVLIHGNGALEVFDAQGMKNSPQWVRIWVFFMLATFACSIFFVWRHVIARWVLGGFVLGVIAMTIVSSMFNIPPYSGFIATFHLIFWSPALYQLFRERPFLDTKTPFAIWSGV